MNSALSAWRPRGLLLALDARQKLIFALVVSAGFFENYDRALLSLAIEQIQSGLRIANRDLGTMLSLIRLGYLLALPIASLADRLGRRRLLIHTVLFYTLATAASALAPDARTFVAFQFVARGFSAAEAAIALVVVAEEIDAAARGSALGWLGALSTCGYGLAALVFALINWMPFGWRGLYALALLPLALLIVLRRWLPETHRFADLQVARGAAWLSPWRGLMRAPRARLGALLAITFLVYLGGAPASMLSFKYLEDVHHWSPTQISSMVIVAGAFGLLGNIVIGTYSDRWGRRRSTALCLLLAPLLMLGFLHSAGAPMVVAWAAELFFDTASVTLLNTYATELFDTPRRATATSAMTVAATLGAALGLWGESLLYTVTTSHWSAISLLTIVWLLTPLGVLLWLPETAGKQLEELAG
ncbi:MAG TPA: MFS transporter [Candidatus Binataceae bacterium]|nr:MFS transporter [Candidatus Binataceae bacterium]